ncbi:MAG: HDIG domain-containing protein [Endomicrobia bacterium]|nr:HDIG domain-containing protein [Endomicrobiia bacterium]
MFKKAIIKIKPLLLDLLKKIEQLEQTMSFQQRISVKKTKIIKLPEKLLSFIFIAVLFISIFIKILWFEKHFSFILILLRLLSLVVLLYLINEIIFQQIKPTIFKIVANFKDESKKNFVIFWTVVILNIVIVLLYTMNNLSFYLLPNVGIVILVGILLSVLYGIVFVLLNVFIISFFYYTGDGRIYLYILFYFLSSLYALGLAEKIYSRKDIFKAIIKSIVFNFIFSFLIEILISNNVADIFNIKFSYKLLFKDDIHILGLLVNNFLSGFLSFSILSIFLPPFETIYQKITNIKLVELSDFSSPLLKRLMSEAPGTYHHSIIVSTLSENVASKLGQNSLLCKVASLYHDIGKLIKPEYFIENQSFLRGPDIDINPSLAALIIINHVKEGVKLAHEHKLDKEIIDIIEQHHGNSVIYGLYDKTLELNYNKDLIRYPGPKPQSKEAAIIMICDSCEAACRSIKDPDAQKIKQAVESVINTKFIDGQFDETPLTLRDLYIISNIVTQMLISLYHLRIRQK